MPEAEELAKHEQTLDTILDLVDVRRTALLEEREFLTRRVEGDSKALEKIAQELVRVEQVLREGGRSPVREEPESQNQVRHRDPHVEKRVRDHAHYLWKTRLSGIETVSEEALVARVLQLYPGTIEKSARSAIRRMERKGEIASTGPASDRHFRMVEKTPAAEGEPALCAEWSVEKKILDALKAKYPEFMTWIDVSWLVQDALSADAAVNNLEVSKLISSMDNGGERSFRFVPQEPSVEPIGQPLFGDAIKP